MDAIEDLNLWEWNGKMNWCEERLWACYGQNESGILFGREQIATIPKKWLQEHLLTVVKNDFEYTDDWNYRRLLELVSKQDPELMKDVLLINSDTNNPDLLEVIEDFR